MTVIRPARAVLRHGASELGHGQDHDVLHTVTQVVVQSPDSFAQLTQAARQLPLSPALANVRIPSTQIGKGDLHAHVGFHELGDLAKRSAEVSVRVLGAARRLVASGIDGLQSTNRFERLFSRGRDRVSSFGAIEAPEGRADLVVPVYSEFAQVRDGQRWMVALHHSR